MGYSTFWWYPLCPWEVFSHFFLEVVVDYSSNLLTLGHKSSSFSQLFVSTEPGKCHRPCLPKWRQTRRPFVQSCRWTSWLLQLLRSAALTSFCSAFRCQHFILMIIPLFNSPVWCSLLRTDWARVKVICNFNRLGNYSCVVCLPIANKILQQVKKQSRFKRVMFVVNFA